MLHAQRLVQSARTYNRQHAEHAAEFTKLTGIDAADFRAVRAWQLSHGLKGDGKVGPATLKAARGNEQESETDRDSEGAAGPGDSTSAKSGSHHNAHPKVKTISFAEDEGSTVEGDSDTSVGGEVLENPNLLDNIVAGAKGQEHKPVEGGAAETVAELGEAGNQGKEGAGLAAGMKAAPVKAPTGMEAAEEEGEEFEAPWIKAAMAPHIIEMLRAGEYLEAAKTLGRTFNPKEWIEGLTFACKKIGLERAVEIFTKAAPYVAGATAAWEMFWWTFDGLMAVAKAHEDGDRNARIRMYSSQFAESFLNGESARAEVTPVTAEEREAVERGARDGAATAASLGELAPSVARDLLRRYGGESQLKHVIVNELLKRAGLDPVYSKAGA